LRCGSAFADLTSSDPVLDAGSRSGRCRWLRRHRASQRDLALQFRCFRRRASLVVLFSKWVGDSEKAVRDLFRKARAASPSRVPSFGSAWAAGCAAKHLSHSLRSRPGMRPLLAGCQCASAPSHGIWPHARQLQHSWSRMRERLLGRATLGSCLLR
jgi:hypothetical protein